jgi:hypothetical protein
MQHLGTPILAFAAILPPPPRRGKTDRDILAIYEYLAAILPATPS